MSVEVHIWNAKKNATLAGIFKKTGHSAIKVTLGKQTAYLSYWPDEKLTAMHWIKGKNIKTKLLTEKETLDYEGNEKPAVIKIKNLLDEKAILKQIQNLNRNWNNLKNIKSPLYKIEYNLRTQNCSSVVLKLLYFDGLGNHYCPCSNKKFDRISPHDVLTYAEKLQKYATVHKNKGTKFGRKVF